MNQGEEKPATDEQIAHLNAIFDKSRRIETDEDLLTLAEMVEDESDESGFDDRDAAGCSGRKRTEGREM